jgi:GxxExxY protein
MGFFGVGGIKEINDTSCQGAIVDSSDEKTLITKKTLMKTKNDPHENRLTAGTYGLEMKYPDLTHKIIGSAMEVHRILGNGFQEVIYQRALKKEFDSQYISHTREIEMPIYYKETAIGSRRVDFFVEEKILVEIKAIVQLEDVHLAQALNYLEAFNIEIGLLLNFGSTSLQFKRLLNKKYKHPIPSIP